MASRMLWVIIRVVRSLASTIRWVASSTLAAVIISDVIFGRIFSNFALKLFAVSIGAVLYYIVIQVVLWLGLDTNLLKLLSALIVALFLALPFWKGKLRAKPGRKGGSRNA